MGLYTDMLGLCHDTIGIYHHIIGLSYRHHRSIPWHTWYRHTGIGAMAAHKSHTGMTEAGMVPHPKACHCIVQPCHCIRSSYHVTVHFCESYHVPVEFCQSYHVAVASCDCVGCAELCPPTWKGPRVMQVCSCPSADHTRHWHCSVRMSCKAVHDNSPVTDDVFKQFHRDRPTTLWYSHFVFVYSLYYAHW